MTTYLSRLVDSPDFECLASLKPAAICPYLYYTISPYIYTIANGGWFSWVKRTANPLDRKPAKIRNPGIKKVNRLFENEVLVRCPNPHENVIAGIGPGEKGAIAVRILHSNGECPCHHIAGQRIMLKDDNDRSLRYSRLFPGILLQAMAGLPLEKAMGLFDQGRAGLITPVRIINPCRYHDRPIRYDSRHLLPDNCCPHVFQHVYPDILATMYNAAVDPVLTVQHPGSGKGMTLKIEKEPIAAPGLTKKLAEGFDFIFGRLFHPLDRLDYNLTIKALDAESGPGCSMRPDNGYPVNLRDRNFLCPAGFHAGYPYLLLAAAGVKMNWRNESMENLLPCPDCAGVVYDITGPS